MSNLLFDDDAVLVFCSKTWYCYTTMQRCKRPAPLHSSNVSLQWRQSICLWRKHPADVHGAGALHPARGQSQRHHRPGRPDCPLPKHFGAVDAEPLRQVSGKRRSEVLLSCSDAVVLDWISSGGRGGWRLISVIALFIYFVTGCNSAEWVCCKWTFLSLLVHFGLSSSHHPTSPLPPGPTSSSSVMFPSVVPQSRSGVQVCHDAPLSHMMEKVCSFHQHFFFIWEVEAAMTSKVWK